MNHRQRPASPGPAAPALPGCPARSFSAAPALRLAVAALVAFASVSSSPAFGQRAAGLPADLKNAANPQARQGEVEKFVSAQVAKLTKGKAPERKEARDALAREASATGAAPNPAFLQLYAEVLNKQLLPVAKNSDPHVRLNAAIALQRVASKVNNGELADAAAAMAQDQCAGVALWATKAAQSIVPPLAAAGKNTKLTGAIVAGVRKHADSGELADEAYKALTLEFPKSLQRINAQSVPVVLPDVLKLFEFRVGLLAKGLPPSPELDASGANFLTFKSVWGHPAAAKLQPAIMQQLANLIGVGAQQAAAAEDPDTRKALIELLRNSGAALGVVGGAMKDANIQAAAKALGDIPGAIEAEELIGLADGAFTAIKAKVPEVKESPTIDEGGAESTDEEPAAPAAEPDAAETSAAGDAADDDDTASAEDAGEARTAAERTRPASDADADGADEER